MNDPETYRAMQVPHESEAVSDAAWKAFYGDVSEARKKHRIATAVFIGEALFTEPDGTTSSRTHLGSLGNGSLVMSMTATALGHLRKQQDDEIERLASGK